MLDKGLVSVIMPTYNCGLYIATAIDSVRSQTYENWELIIYDDCSTDDTQHIVNGYTSIDSRIHYIRSERNRGAAVTRNEAIKRAKGRWIAFLDSDDLWLPEKLEKQIRFMSDNDYAFSYHEYTEMFEDGSSSGVYVSGKKVVRKLDMYACCWPGCLSVMYDQEQIGLVQINDIKTHNDIALWLKIIQKTRCYLLKENLAQYRRRKNSITPSIPKRILWYYRLFREAEEMPIYKVLFWMVVNIVGNSYKKLFFVKHTENR